MMEVCVDSVASAMNAESGGAVRVELCANLGEGGTTPSIGMLHVIKQNVTIPVFAMIRPRGGDFLYSEEEYEVMRFDMTALKEAGADGFVFGILSQNGDVDNERCRELVNLAKPLSSTFHRAIDMTKDVMKALNDVIMLRFERVLTSGGEASALDGLQLLKKMIETAHDRIIVVPGGGINQRNLERILKGCGAHEFHGSARSEIDSLMSHRKGGVPMGASYGPPEFSRKVADTDKVRDLVGMFTEMGNNN